MRKAFAALDHNPYIGKKGVAFYTIVSILGISSYFIHPDIRRQREADRKVREELKKAQAHLIEQPN